MKKNLMSDRAMFLVYILYIVFNASKPDFI